MLYIFKKINYFLLFNHEHDMISYLCNKIIKALCHVLNICNNC